MFFLTKRGKFGYSNWQQEEEDIWAFISRGNKTSYLISRTPFLLVFLIIMSLLPSNLTYMTSGGNLIEDVLCWKIIHETTTLGEQLNLRTQVLLLLFILISYYGILNPKTNFVSPLLLLIYTCLNIYETNTTYYTIYKKLKNLILYDLKKYTLF